MPIARHWCGDRSTSASGTPAGGYLYDVVDGENGDDPSLRPNQIFAISLPHPVLDRHRWQPVLTQVVERLLTPVGLRSLAPGHPDYKATVRRRPARPRRRLSSGNGLGLADRSLHRRLAQGPSRGPVDRTRLPRRLRAAPERGLHRLDQRDLRRRSALHAPRLHRPGLERGRSAPRWVKTHREP